MSLVPAWTITVGCVLLGGCSGDVSTGPDLPPPQAGGMAKPSTAPGQAMPPVVEAIPMPPPPVVPTPVAPQPVFDVDEGAFLGLAAPERGFRIATRGREIPAGADVEYCEVAELPGTPDQEYLVNVIESANGIGSHHLIVSAAQPGSLADQHLRGLEVGEQVECIGAEIEFGADGMRSIAGTQTPHAEVRYPVGVGIRLHGGQRIVFDYHYFNFTDAPLQAQSAIAVHTLEPTSGITVAASFAMTNFTLDTPPGTERTFTAECTFSQDVMIQGLGRHTHAQGTDFSVWFEGGARHGEHIWTSHDWEHDIGYTFEEPLLVRAGEGFRFACGFHNPGTRPLRFGISASDEMCILVGAIWSPTPGVEVAPESCVIVWTDAEGIGHAADDEGGFPAPTLDEAAQCHAGFLGVGAVVPCVGCMCDRCGSVLNRCNADADCKPLLDCYTTCGQQDPNADCGLFCEQEMFQYSSGVGMVTQVGQCISAMCDSC